MRYGNTARILAIPVWTVSGLSEGVFWVENSEV